MSKTPYMTDDGKAIYKLKFKGDKKKTPDEILLGLSLCAPDGRCQYKTNHNCPYAITEFQCGRSQLMTDAFDLITDLKKQNDAKKDTLTEIKNLLGCNCDDCDRCD